MNDTINKTAEASNNTARQTTGTVGNVGGLGSCTITYPYHRKSLSCPYCTPRCPHGYPVEEAVGPSWVNPFVPNWSITDQKYTIS